MDEVTAKYGIYFFAYDFIALLSCSFLSTTLKNYFLRKLICENDFVEICLFSKCLSPCVRACVIVNSGFYRRRIGFDFRAIGLRH